MLRVRYPVSTMTIWRWTNDPVVQFPRPIKAGAQHNARALWDVAELDAWDARQKPART
jgi:predicted DNA-binding transcriptional regulator AlpA